MLNLFLKIYSILEFLIVKIASFISSSINIVIIFKNEIKWKIMGGKARMKYLISLFIPSYILFFRCLFHFFEIKNALFFVILIVITSLIILPHLYFFLLDKDFTYFFNVYEILINNNINNDNIISNNIANRDKQIFLKQSENHFHNGLINIISEFYDFLIEKGKIDSQIQKKETFTTAISLLTKYPNLLIEINLNANIKSANTIIKYFLVDFLNINASVACSHIYINNNKKVRRNLLISTYRKCDYDVELQDDIQFFLKHNANYSK